MTSNTKPLIEIRLESSGYKVPPLDDETAEVIRQNLQVYLERKGLEALFVQPKHNEWPTPPGQIGDDTSISGLEKSAADLSRKLGSNLASKAFDAISDQAQQLQSGLISVSIPSEQRHHLWGANSLVDPDYTEKRNDLVRVVVDALKHASASPYKKGRVQISNHIAVGRHIAPDFKP